MVDLESLSCRAIELGARESKIIFTREIIIKDWVRLKCKYGCGGYGERLTCPPYSPTPEETRRIISGYKRALLMRFRSCEECGDSLAVNIHRVVADLEKEVFLSGYYAAFGMACGPCNLCEECNLKECRYPHLARPAMEACGIDVFATARKAGFEIEVLTSRDQIPTCYALLLIE